MGSEKEVCNSDTLERSNISSLQSDNNSSKKSFQLNNCVCPQNPYGNVKFIPCPILNFDPIGYSAPCVCQYQSNQNDPLKQIDSEHKVKSWHQFNLNCYRSSCGNKKDKQWDAKCKNKNTQSDKVLEGIHSQYCDGIKNIENPTKQNASTESEIDNPEKIEIYYFDHGNSGYYHTTDTPPILKTEKFAEKTNSKLTEIFAEIFGCFHLVASLFTTFILQCIRFVLFSLVRPLTVGVIQLVADYFIKPLLSITFNGLIQPFLILFYNIATSFRDCCEPLATTLGFYIKEVAILFRSCRLIEITHNYKNNPNT